MTTPPTKRTQANAPEPSKPAPASPGDNRSADDVDGNRSGGASKAKGVTEPESADEEPPARS